MHIWFGFACAKDRETLERESKPSHIVKVSDLNEFRAWLGDMFTKAYDLYSRVESDINVDTSEAEDALAKIRNSSVWLDLLDFVRRQIELSRKENFLANELHLKLGEDYHSLIDLFQSTNDSLSIMGTKIVFTKVDQKGIYREAVAIILESKS